MESDGSSRNFCAAGMNRLEGKQQELLHSMAKVQLRIQCFCCKITERKCVMGNESGD